MCRKKIQCDFIKSDTKASNFSSRMEYNVNVLNLLVMVICSKFGTLDINYRVTSQPNISEARHFCNPKSWTAKKTKFLVMKKT